jgi:hypothetical protein
MRVTHKVQLISQLLTHSHTGLIYEFPYAGLESDEHLSENMIDHQGHLLFITLNFKIVGIVRLSVTKSLTVLNNLRNEQANIGGTR